MGSVRDEPTRCHLPACGRIWECCQPKFGDVGVVTGRYATSMGGQTSRNMGFVFQIPLTTGASPSVRHLRAVPWDRVIADRITRIRSSSL